MGIGQTEQTKIWDWPDRADFGQTIVQTVGQTIQQTVVKPNG